MENILLRHALIVTMDKVLIDCGYIAMRDGRILSVGPEPVPDCYLSFPSLDMSGKLLMPGMINTHTHLGMVSFRSLEDDCPDRLNRFLMPLERKAMNEKLAVSSAKIAIAEMIRSGVTSAVDMYYYEDKIAVASEEMGFRLWAGETLLDSSHPGASNFKESLERTEECIRVCENLKLVKPIIAPHAPYSLSPEHIALCRERAKALGLMWTMHIEEMPYEKELFREKYRMSPVKFLNREALIDDSFLAVHLITADMEDLEILSSFSVPVAHCPGSNAKAAKGVAPITSLIGKVPFTLGTDGPASGNTLDLFTQMKTFAYLHKNRLHDRSAFPTCTIVPLTTSEAGRALKEEIGMIKTGYRADIVALSLKMPQMIPCHNPYSVIVYSSSPLSVTDVWIEGKQLLRDGEFTNFDFNDIQSEFDEVSLEFSECAKN